MGTSLVASGLGDANVSLGGTDTIALSVTNEGMFPRGYRADLNLDGASLRSVGLRVPEPARLHATDLARTVRAFCARLSVHPHVTDLTVRQGETS